MRKSLKKISAFFYSIMGRQNKINASSLILFYKLTAINSAPIWRICSAICFSRSADGRLLPLMY